MTFLLYIGKNKDFLRKFSKLENVQMIYAHILKNQQFPTHVIPKSEKDSHLYVIIDRPQPKEPMSIYEYKF